MATLGNFIREVGVERFDGIPRQNCQGFARGLKSVPGHESGPDIVCKPRKLKLLSMGLSPPLFLLAWSVSFYLNSRPPSYFLVLHYCFPIPDRRICPIFGSYGLGVVGIEVVFGDTRILNYQK